MTGIAHLHEDLAAIEREIAHCAQFCGIDIHDEVAVRNLLKDAGRSPHSRDEQHRQRMIGLIVLRARLMIEIARAGR